MSEFTFGQVEATLAAINNIADHKRVAFAGRLKFLQKNGLLERERGRPGRGKAGIYSFAQTVQLALGVELLTFGLTPQRAAQLVERNWPHLRWSTYLSTFSEMEARELGEVNFRDEQPEVNWLWLIHANALAELTTDGGSEYDTYEAIEAVSLKELPKMLEMYGDIGESHGRRTMLVNGSALTRTVLYKVAFDFRFTSVEAMREDLLDEARRESERIEKLGELLPLLTDEQKADLQRRLKEKNETDFSTVPPTPPEVVRQHAADVFQQLTPAAKEVLQLLAREQQIVINEATRPSMIELAEFGVLEVPETRLQQYGNFSIEFTTVGKAVIKLFGEDADVY